MTCPRCHGFVTDCSDMDEQGDPCELVRCVNCGFRQVVEPVGKRIEVVRGHYYL